MENIEDVKQDSAEPIATDEVPNTTVKPKAITMIESANQVVQAQKVENDRTEKLVTELKELKAINMLGGGTDAGQPKETKNEAEILADEMVNAFKKK